MNLLDIFAIIGIAAVWLGVAVLICIAVGRWVR